MLALGALAAPSGAKDTFAVDIFALDAARAELAPLAEKVWRHCEAKHLYGRTVTLKVKFTDFQQVTPAVPFQGSC